MRIGRQAELCKEQEQEEGRIPVLVKRPEQVACDVVGGASKGPVSQRNAFGLHPDRALEVLCVRVCAQVRECNFIFY